MITKDDVLKAIVDCQKPNGRTDYRDIMDKLKIDDISLLPSLKELKELGYIVQTQEDVTVTSLGMSAYKDLKPSKAIKKSVYNFSKFTLQRFIDILVGIIIGVSVAYLVYHFGWQQP